MELENLPEKILIYGAKSIALGIRYAVECLYPSKEIVGFLVSAGKDNPKNLGGLPVMEIADYSEKCPDKDKAFILIGTPEVVHDEIAGMLKRHGFFHYICIGWELEESLMEQYYARRHRFPSLHSMECSGRKQNQISGIEIALKETAQHIQDIQEKEFQVFLAKSHKDAAVQKPWDKQTWVHTLQAGAGLTDSRIAEHADCTGRNISFKNGNYCELTALYWIWKNELKGTEINRGYCGMFQYRRLLNIEEEDISRIIENQIDVILPFPTMHEPDIREHHARHIKEEDWRAMLQALKELQPDYIEPFRKLLRQPYLYNYNILVAKRKILREYCEWLFPILERTEMLSNPKGWERNDRYIGYLGENLLTLYFMYHANNLRIAHTGRVMLV